jgi:5-methylcytosine-specific restriction endonuclease McrA
MPKGVYKHKKLSEEHKRKISEAGKGKVAWNKGVTGYYKASEEQKEKQSKLRKGIWKNSKEAIEKIRVKAIGRGHTLESRLKMSEGRKGTKHWHWEGGKTSENLRIRNGIKIQLWRSAVFSRDGFTCQKCGQVGGQLNVHHILSFRDNKEIRTAINNGITFCKLCHISFHKKYGRYDNNSEQIKDYIYGTEQEWNSGTAV